jgi:hypothetical protein
VILVEILDDEFRVDLGRFLDASFPGDAFDRETGFALDFRASGMSPEVEIRLAERLLWAWHSEHQPPTDVELLLTASASGSFASDERPATIQRRVRFISGPQDGLERPPTGL